MTLDEELIVSLDTDGDGVDKAEFVLGMLEKLSIISHDDYAPFVEQFLRMDESGNGRLTRDDLAAIAQANQLRKRELQEETERREREHHDETKLQRCALDLLGPTFISSLAFTWHPLSYGVKLHISYMDPLRGTRSP